MSDVRCRKSEGQEGTDARSRKSEVRRERTPVFAFGYAVAGRAEDRGRKTEIRRQPPAHRGLRPGGRAEIRRQPPAHRGLPSRRAVSSMSRKPACKPYGLEAAPVGGRNSGWWDE